MPPVVIAGGIAAAGAIGGAVMSSSAQKKAAKTAATAETNAANSNIAAAQQFQAQNQANLQPFLNSGTQSNALINSFLFGPQGGGTGGGNSGAPAAPMGQDWNGYLQANPDVAAEGQRVTADGEFPSLQAYAQWHYQHYGQNEGRQVPQFGAQQNALAGGAGQAGIDAYQAFTQSPTYQFPLQEGMRQLNTGLASHGQIHSGDAMKAAIGYGQNYASGQLNNFLGLAENQANRGIQAGGAIAGVGVNALNSISNSNNAVGQAAANRAIAGGVANSQMYAGIGSALGNLAGSFMPTSSYRF